MTMTKPEGVEAVSNANEVADAWEELIRHYSALAYRRGKLAGFVLGVVGVTIGQIIGTWLFRLLHP